MKTSYNKLFKEVLITIPEKKVINPLYYPEIRSHF